MIKYSEYEELKSAETYLLPLAKKFIMDFYTEHTDLDLIMMPRYKLISHNNSVLITHIQSNKNHPLIMEKLYLLSIIINKNDYPHDVYYYIISIYMDLLNQIVREIVSNIIKAEKSYCAFGPTGPPGGLMQLITYGYDKHLHQLISHKSKSQYDKKIKQDTKIYNCKKNKINYR